MDKKKLSLVIIILTMMMVGMFVWMKFFSTEKNKSAPSSSRTMLPKSPEAFYPAQIIDLASWKLTVPLRDESDASSPLDITQPELATYQINPWFMATADKKGIVFRAPVNAPTTANSGYPRSELREMNADGSDETVWSTKTGTHTLFLDQAITAVPNSKKHVVAGQIHGDDDDLLVIRLEDTKLYVTRSKSNAVTLDENYVLGKRFSIKFVASDGEIAVYYNNGSEPAYVLKKKVDEAYFKVGVYTQSNCETEKLPELCSGDNYGEVVVYQARVTHE